MDVGRTISLVSTQIFVGRVMLLKEFAVTETMHYGEVAMGIWTQDFFIFEREIYLEYLDTDKMRGKSI